VQAAPPVPHMPADCWLPRTHVLPEQQPAQLCGPHPFPTGTQMPVTQTVPAPQTCAQELSGASSTGKTHDPNTTWIVTRA
jgi:hypothetical protein